MADSDNEKNQNKKTMIALAILAYIGGFFFYSVAWNVRDVTEIFLAPLFISIVAVVIFTALGAIFNPKLRLIVFGLGVLALLIWSWNTPKNWQDCVLAETKSAKTDSAMAQIVRICRQKYGVN